MIPYNFSLKSMHYTICNLDLFLCSTPTEKNAPLRNRIDIFQWLDTFAKSVLDLYIFLGLSR